MTTKKPKGPPDGERKASPSRVATATGTAAKPPEPAAEPSAPQAPAVKRQDDNPATTPVPQTPEQRAQPKRQPVAEVVPAAASSAAQPEVPVTPLSEPQTEVSVAPAAAAAPAQLADGVPGAEAAPEEEAEVPSAASPVTETAVVEPVLEITAEAPLDRVEPFALPQPDTSAAGVAAAAPEPEPEPEPEPAHSAVPEAETAYWPEPVATPEPEPPPQPHRPSMFIVHISPEIAPVAKVGGLADVVFGLAKEQEIRGNHVEIILPKYDSLRYDQIWGLTETYNDLWVPWYGGSIHCTVYFGFAHGRKCFFIEPHSADNFFNRGCIYGFNDDILRFAFFSRAALEFLWKSGKQPEIIHCHDWQTALVPVFLYEIYQHLGMTHPRVCFTIHNFKHQGVTGANLLHATGLNRPEYYFHYDRLRDNHNVHALNLTKGGVVYANFVTTVSPRHAIEAKDQGEGFGLEPTLHIHHQKYGGVLNGIDYEAWNPEIDRYIPFHYSINNLDDKYKNKIALRDRLLLSDNEKPIVAFIGRLDPQKGLELIRHALFYTLHRNGQFILLGSSPDSQINNYFWGLKHQLNDNPDCHLEIGFNEELSHLIYAGADIVIVPSRFEPCGLTQMIAMRYGTIPVVREVGGLADTVFDKDHSHRPLHERNGYMFRDYDFGGLESALGRAVSCYYEFPEHFRELIKNAMRYDYSWNHPGQDYMNIYEYIREK